MTPVRKGVCSRLCMLYYVHKLHTVISLSTEDITDITDNNVTITLSWEKDVGVFYNVHVVPRIMVNFMTTSQSVKLTMSYNVSYIVTIVGRLCRKNISSVVREFRYGELINVT